MNASDNSIPLCIYRALLGHAPEMETLVARDIDEAGEFWAARITQALQDSMAVPPGEPIVVNFCTGDTPWIGYRRLIDWLRDWEGEETRRALKRHGLDPKRRPDMARVVAFPLDAIFPQRRDAYCAFGRMLHSLFDQLGIPEANRRLFYGDWIEDGSGIRAMTDAEFGELSADVGMRGLLLDSYREGRLAGIQLRHLRAMERHARAMSLEIQDLGGSRIFLWGVGPSYSGEGHVGFMEAGTSFDASAFVEAAGYHINAGHAKENSGIARMYAANGASRHGFVTFGFHELLQRHRRGQDQAVIGIATNNSKAESVRRFLEGPASERRPLTAMQACRGTIILDCGSAHRLRPMTHPWEFREIERWDTSLVRRFFCRTALDAGLSLRRIRPEDIDAGPAGIPKCLRDIRRHNVRRMIAETGGEDWPKDLEGRLAGELFSAAGLVEGLGLASGSTVLFINPHMDDEFLALYHVIRELAARGHRVCTYYLAKGHTAVHDDYLFVALEEIRGLSDEELASPPPYRDIMSELMAECAGSTAGLRKADDFEVWPKMSARERKLRALALSSQIRDDFLSRNALSPRQIRSLADFLIAATRSKEEWGGIDLELAARLKSWLRVTEAVTALMSLGVAFEDIHPPLEVSWYVSFGRGTTAKTDDIEQVRKIIDREAPSAIFTNGEGFPDYGAHSTTEITVSLALLELTRDGAADFDCIQYAGVWERTRADESAMSVVLSEAELREFRHAFLAFYPSQAPAPVPDAGARQIEFFSDRVCENAGQTKEEWLAILGMGMPEKVREVLASPGSGALNYKRLNPRNPEFRASTERKKLELERVRIAKERSNTSTFQGLPRKPFASPFLGLLGDIPPESVLSPDER